MTQGTVLLSIPDVTASQVDDSSQPTVLVNSTTLCLKLVDIPSTVLKSIPSTSRPPSYLSASTSDQPAGIIVDTWLVLSLADGLIDIPLSSETLLTFQPPRAYLIPILPGDAPTDQKVEKSRADGIIKLDIGSSVDEDSLDTLDSILAGWTAYNGRNIPPSSSPVIANSPINQPPQYGEQPLPQGRLALVDEKTGEICGELASDVMVEATPVVAHHPPSSLIATPETVLVSFTPADQSNSQAHAQVTALSPESHSKILVGADWVSRGILTGSGMLSNLIEKGGSTIVSRNQAATNPTSVSPTTQARAERVVGYTQSAAKLSGKTAKIVGNLAGRVGDSIGKSTGIQRGPKGEIPTGARGYLHKGAMAFNTVLDSIEVGGKKVLQTAGDTTTNVVRHSYGPEAGEIAQKANQGVQNVALVYIDARGITKRAILKTVGKGAIKGTTKDGREVVFGSEESLGKIGESSSPTHLSSDHSISTSSNSHTKQLNSPEEVKNIQSGKGKTRYS